MLEEEDAQERGHRMSPSSKRGGTDDSSDEEPSPAIGMLRADQPLSQAAQARMQKEALVQLVIVIKPNPEDQCYLFGRRDTGDMQLRHHNAKQISDQIFSYEALPEDAGQPPMPETVAPYDVTDTDGEHIEGLIVALVSPQLIAYHFHKHSTHLARSSNRKLKGTAIEVIQTKRGAGGATEEVQTWITYEVLRMEDIHLATRLQGIAIGEPDPLKKRLMIDLPLSSALMSGNCHTRTSYTCSEDMKTLLCNEYIELAGHAKDVGHFRAVKEIRQEATEQAKYM